MIKTYEQMWTDTLDVNEQILNLFTQKVNNDFTLTAHRNYIEQNNYGFGDRAFHYIWKILIEEMPKVFNYLEIGVYMGQVLTLVQVLSREAGKKCMSVIVSPFSSAGDCYSSYPSLDYLQAVKNLYTLWCLDFSRVEVIHGLSTADSSKVRVLAHTYDLIYIDGSHAYADVVSDIALAKKCLKSKGYLVMDDASYFLNMPDNCFKGHPESSQAVRDCLESDKNYKHVFACGHNRLWRKNNG